jgi:hypothetical protein
MHEKTKMTADKAMQNFRNLLIVLPKLQNNTVDANEMNLCD